MSNTDLRLELIHARNMIKNAQSIEKPTMFIFPNDQCLQAFRKLYDIESTEYDFLFKDLNEENNSKR